MFNPNYEKRIQRLERQVKDLQRNQTKPMAIPTPPKKSISLPTSLKLSPPSLIDRVEKM